ncbi:MAG TPA: phospholipase D-like domain-containing protein, partial [Burkholderiales bacterium]|nr:phospholipase D-like domain-containing protein [Burkholderiales bacterium]
MAGEFQVVGQNAAALFTLKVHRGDGMALLAMNWKVGKPPTDFVGFAIEYKEPNGQKFYVLNNRLSFLGASGAVNPNTMSTRLSPIQKFRWVHFPLNAELPGEFVYQVTPVFMNNKDVLSYGDAQQVAIELRRETYPGQLNVAFTRGFVSSQAFVDRYGAASIPALLPADADMGLEFVPTYSKAEIALAWMGFEARSAIHEVLDQAIADKGAQVRAVIYDLNEPAVVSRLEKLGKRLKIIIDNEGPHGAAGSAETKAATRLAASAGAGNVKRQHMGNLQHNKIVVVDGPKVQTAVCGSTNQSWRGYYVQNNNAIVLSGKAAVKVFVTAFNNYWAHDNVAGFNVTASAKWNSLGLKGINAKIGFSPLSKNNSVLQSIADDIAGKTTSNLFFSLAFLYQTPGAIQDAIKKIKNDKKVFSYGISDHQVKSLDDTETSGIDLQKPSGIVKVVSPAALGDNVPEPFKSEPVGGGGTRMHHKFVVIDFD